ncbi:MAG TPA: hypothetical protein HPP54_09205 [Nitrospinae bacterium]|nr:hypothetical protein [Nitrospinota bacterium]
MKQNKTLIFAAAALMIVASFVATPNAKADTAPGEGFYTGAFLGYGSGLISADVTSIARAGGGLNENATFKSDRGGLGLSGIQGGGWLGWGMKTADDLYFGAEISGAGSDEKIELSSTVGIKDDDGVTNITSMSAKRNWVAGGAVRVGYYLNTSTLFSLTGGVAVSQFAVKIGSDKETYYAGGPQVGAQVETQLSKIDPNLSLRMEFVYTDYLTADISGMDGVGEGTGADNNSELTGSDSAGRVGIVYRF